MKGMVLNAMNKDQLINDVVLDFVKYYKESRESEIDINYVLPLDQSKPLLQFFHKDGVVENIANVTSLQEAREIIQSILKNSLYNNYTIENNLTHIDIRFRKFRHYFKIINLTRGEFH